MGDRCKPCNRRDYETPWRKWKCFLGPKGDESSKSDLQQSDQVSGIGLKPSPDPQPPYQPGFRLVSHVICDHQETPTGISLMAIFCIQGQHKQRHVSWQPVRHMLC